MGIVRELGDTFPIIRLLNVGLIGGRVGIIGMAVGIIVGGELAMYVGMTVGIIIGIIAGVLGLLVIGNATITSVLDNMGPAMRAEVSEFSIERQARFLEGYRKNERRVWVAYISSLGGGHYDYLGKPRVGLLMTMTWIVGVGIVWWLVDIYRIPGMVLEHNQRAAANLVFSMRIRSGTHTDDSIST